MHITLAAVAILVPGISPAQGDVWSLELLERYAAWVRGGGSACPLATRVVDVGPADGGMVFKVTCGTATMPVTGEEVAFRLTVRQDGSRRVQPWRE